MCNADHPYHLNRGSTPLGIFHFLRVFFVPVQAEPLHICITGAAGQIAYSLLYSVAKGDVFGSDTVSSLRHHHTFGSLV